MFNLPLFSSLPSCLSSTRPKDLRLRNPSLVSFAVDRGEVEVGKVPLRGASGREPTRRPGIKKEHQVTTRTNLRASLTCATRPIALEDHEFISRFTTQTSEICILTT